MDWAPIVAGGITGLLSGAVSGNFVQYILDKRRLRDKKRLEFLEMWEEILANKSLKYVDIISQSSFELLKGFIAPKTRSLLNSRIAGTEEKRRRLQFLLDDYYEFHDDAISAAQYGQDGADHSRIESIIEGADHWREELADLEHHAKKYIVEKLIKEILFLKKKWGII